MPRLRRDRPALVLLAVFALGALLLTGVLLALLLPGGGRHAAPTTAGPPASTGSTTTSTRLPPAKTTPVPPPSGPLRAASVGPFSATVEWAGPDPPARIGYGLPEFGPTLWAPVSSGRATLTGLRSGATYRVWAGDATLDVTTAPPPDSPVAGVAAGTVRLDGEPFFPLLLLAQCGGNYDAGLEAGMTVFIENGCGGIADQSASLAGRALSLTAASEAGIGGPGVIGWYYPDEPDLMRLTGETLPHFPTLGATGRLRVLTLSNHVYSRTEPLAEGRGVYPGLIAQADLVGFDLYPLQEFCAANWLPDVAAAQRELVSLAAGRPTFQWIETRSWRCRAPGLRVTPATVRAESWLAVAGGAAGLGFFPADWPADVAPGIAAVAKEVAALAPALLAPAAPVSASGSIIAAARSFRGAFYVIAVNPSRRTVEATVHAPGLSGGQAAVLGEARTIPVSGDALTDAFGPLAVHLYVVAP